MCDFCENDKPIFVSKGTFGKVNVSITNYTHQLEVNIKDDIISRSFMTLINYCPMCGSKF
jgi:hypothetical protein